MAEAEECRGRQRKASDHFCRSASDAKVCDPIMWQFIMLRLQNKAASDGSKGVLRCWLVFDTLQAAEEKEVEVGGQTEEEGREES